MIYQIMAKNIQFTQIMIENLKGADSGNWSDTNRII